MSFKKRYFLFQRPHKATQDEMTKFHSDDYIRFIRSIRPDNMNEYNKQMQKCKFYLLCYLQIKKKFFNGFVDWIERLDVLSSTEKRGRQDALIAQETAVFQ